MTPAGSPPAGAKRRPGRPPGKQAAPGARRAEYLEAAMDAIRAVGPSATMTEIAERAGMSKPVLYDHFGDRLGLTVAVVAKMAQTVATDAVRVVLAGGEPGDAAGRRLRRVRRAGRARARAVPLDPPRCPGHARLAWRSCPWRWKAAPAWPPSSAPRCGPRAPTPGPPSPGRSASSASCSPPPNGGWCAAPCAARSSSTTWPSSCGPGCRPAA